MFLFELETAFIASVDKLNQFSSSVINILQNGKQKGRFSHAPIDGIAKHRTGNASRNGHIMDMDIALAASPGVEKIWRFFYGTATKDLFRSSIFNFSIFLSCKLPPYSFSCRIVK